MEAVKNNNIKRMNYKSLLIENIKYRTLLTEKYKKRKPYQKKDEKSIIAFIPGTIVELSVKDSSKVKMGDQLMVLEAMKMKNNIIAPMDGVIKKVYIKTGERVKKDHVLIEFE